MDNHNLEQRTDDLEKRVVALEEKVQAQPTLEQIAEEVLQKITNQVCKVTRAI